MYSKLIIIILFTTEEALYDHGLGNSIFSFMQLNENFSKHGGSYILVFYNYHPHYDPHPCMCTKNRMYQSSYCVI